MLTYLFWAWVAFSSVVAIAVMGIIVYAIIDWLQWKKEQKIEEYGDGE